MSMENEKENMGFVIRDRRGEEKEEPPKKEEPSPTKPRSSVPPRSSAGMDFSTFVLSLSSSAAIHMGLVPDPQTKKTQKNLPLAKQEIDILEMLQAKTKGNLSSQEQQLLEEALYELRVRFVELNS